MIPAGDALRELAQFRPCEQIAQLGLTDQDDLQQLGRRRLEIGEQPHLLERVRTQVLRLVDDQHDAPSARVRVEQSAADQVHQELDAAAAGFGHRDAQLFADGQQEFGGRDPRVQDQRDVGVAPGAAPAGCG